MVFLNETARLKNTVEDVKKLYSLAYKLGLKGVAYMRDGSREGVLSKMPEKEEKKQQEQSKYLVKPRPLVVHGSTYKMSTPVRSAFITINSDDDGEPHEIFVTVGKAGTDVNAMAAGLGRVISVALRFSSHLTPQERVGEIIKQMQGIGGARATGFGKERILSLPDAIAKVLLMHFTRKQQMEKLNAHISPKEYANGHSEDIKETAEDLSTAAQLSSKVLQPSLMQASGATAHFDLCSDCGNNTLANEEGCIKCYTCGYSAC